MPHRNTYVDKEGDTEAEQPDHAESEEDEAKRNEDMLLAKENKRCELLLALGKLACAGSGCLLPAEGVNSTWESTACRLCDTPQPGHRSEQTYWDRGDSGEDWKDAIAALMAIVGLQEFRESTKPRVYMALALRRVFNHISAAEYLDLESSTLAEWLLASMSRSLRELRICAV